MTDTTPTRLYGWHGESRDVRSGAWTHPELYAALDSNLELAQIYADDGGDGGRVFRISFDARKPLILSDPATAAAAINASGMLSTPGAFHGHTGEASSHAFAEWARTQGYDAVVFEPACFEQTDESDAAYAAWDTVAGTFGDPQMIILEPARVEWQVKQ